MYGGCQVVTKDGHIVAMEFCRTEQLDDSSWTIDDEQTVKLKADFVISAFGSELGQSDGMEMNIIYLCILYKYRIILIWVLQW